MKILFRKTFTVLSLFVLFSLSTSAFAITAVPQDGYRASAIPASFGGGFDFLPNGDLVGLSTSPDFLSLRLMLIDGNGDHVPATPQTLATLPAGILFGTFVKVSPSGNTVILAESSTNKIFRYDLQNNNLTQLMTLAGIFEGVFIDETHMYLSTGSFSGAGDVWYWNWQSPALPVRIMSATSGDAAAGGIGADDTGSLYYLKTTNTFPPPPNSHHLYQFTYNQILDVLNHVRPVLQPADGTLIANMNTGFGVQVNAFGDIFASETGSDGNAPRVTRVKRDGTLVPFLTFQGLQGFEFMSVLAFQNKHSFFDPYQASPSRIAILLDDFQNPQVYVVETNPSDPFADQVIASQLAPPFNNPSLILGAPIGGGTASPNNSSLVSLVDGSGFVTVGFNGGVSDGKESLYGSDLIGFGNAVYISGNPLQHSTEPGFVEVKADLNHNGNLDDDPWFLIEPSVLPLNLTPPYSALPLQNYVDYNPTLILGDTNGDNIIDIPNMSPIDFYTIPDFSSVAGNPESFGISAGSGGGDALDLRNAIVETSPGVPFQDAQGNFRKVYLEKVDQVRIHDARAGDSVTTKVDAVSAAKNHVVGNVITVSNIGQLQTAVNTANEGDLIRLLPGTYLLTSAIFLRPGVSLEGPAGLWTANYTGDDAILNGANLASDEAAVTVNAHQPILNQDFSISGLHFQNCPVGIRIDGHRPSIEENFFAKCKTSIQISNVSDSTVVVRGNVIGHRGRLAPAGLSTTGISVSAAKVALIHNTIVYNTTVGLVYGSGANIYLRDNIFAFNKKGVREESAGDLFGEYNDFYGNTIHISGAGVFEHNVFDNPMFAFPQVGDYRLKEESLVRHSGMGGADPGVYDGIHFTPYDIQALLQAIPVRFR